MRLIVELCMPTARPANGLVTSSSVGPETGSEQLAQRWSGHKPVLPGNLFQWTRLPEPRCQTFGESLAPEEYLSSNRVSCILVSEMIRKDLARSTGFHPACFHFDNTGSRLVITYGLILADAFLNILHFAHGMLADRGQEGVGDRESGVDNREAGSAKPLSSRLCRERTTRDILSSESRGRSQTVKRHPALIWIGVPLRLAIQLAA